MWCAPTRVPIDEPLRAPLIRSPSQWISLIKLNDNCRIAPLSLRCACTPRLITGSSATNLLLLDFWFP